MIFESFKGVIALDIDGTITDQAHTIHHEVVSYLKELYEEGWKFVFITGRSYQWGFRVLTHLPFPYTFAFQNGALILEMPSLKILSKKYLKNVILSQMEEICQEENTGFTIYSGWEYQDVCFYNPKHFSAELSDYIRGRYLKLDEKWFSIDNYNDIPLTEFLSLKCFASNPKAAFSLSHRIENEMGLHAPVNRDPYNQAYYVIQATHPEANKGEALKTFIQGNSNKGPVIAAGDDLNDLSMLRLADIKVVMDDAPDQLKKTADIIAPTASKNGIIEGLERALRIIDERKLSND
ncbi:MAG: HAD-IIB family hydrolase [Parachlamydiaceae bacterium]|nr:HAD-IIB family hydrolase [Parachlamydiaceae bacterium]